MNKDDDDILKYLKNNKLYNTLYNKLFNKGYEKISYYK